MDDAVAALDALFEKPKARRRVRGYRPRNRLQNLTAVCKRCSVTYSPKDKRRITYCSRDCSYADLADRTAATQAKAEERREAKAQYRDGAKDRQRQYNRLRNASLDTVDRSPRPCVECGTVFATSYGDKRQSLCSDACGRRQARRKRKPFERARLRGATVETFDPIEIMERDGWRCQLCSRKTPKKLRGTYEPNAPELDHIVPLAIGGAHSRANTQCLCRECNGVKGAKPLGQQRLFG